MIIKGRNQIRFNPTTMKAILQDHLDRQTLGDEPKVTEVTMVTENGCVWFVVEVDGTVEKPAPGVR